METYFQSIVTRRAPLMEQKLHTFQEKLISLNF